MKQIFRYGESTWEVRMSKGTGKSFSTQFSAPQIYS
jgi:hypothetical protein